MSFKLTDQNFSSEEESIAYLLVDSQLSLNSLSQDLVDKCILDNTFDNPAYIRNEQAGRSNWNTDDTIVTYSFEGDSIVLPRGYLQDLQANSQQLGVTLKILDKRSESHCCYSDQLLGISLRPYQERAVKAALSREQGVIISPTGSGKTIIGLEIIRQRSQKALILVHRGELAKQWIAVIQDRLGIKAGFIGDGKCEIGDKVTVAMVQTLSAKGTNLKTLSGLFGLVLVDEAHHTPSASLFSVLSQLQCKYRYGLSATPTRADGLEPLIYLSVGPELTRISKSEVEQLGATVPASVNLVNTNFRPKQADSWNEYIHTITIDLTRNESIISLANHCNGAVLILVDRVYHAQQLSDMLTRRGLDHVLAHGQLKKKEIAERMESIQKAKITIGTCGLLGEGIDIAVWSNLIIASPISSEAKLMQAIGRIVRPAQGKTEATVYDLKDDCGFAGSSFKKRFEIYKKHDIWVKFPKKDQDGGNLFYKSCNRLEKSNSSSCLHRQQHNRVNHTKSTI